MKKKTANSKTDKKTGRIKSLTNFLKVTLVLINIGLIILVGLRGWGRFTQWRNSMHTPVTPADISYEFQTIETKNYPVTISKPGGPGELSVISIGNYQITCTYDDFLKLSHSDNVNTEVYLVKFKNNKFLGGERTFVHFSCLGQPRFEETDLTPYIEYCCIVFTNKVYSVFFFEDKDAYQAQAPGNEVK